MRDKMSRAKDLLTLLEWDNPAGSNARDDQDEWGFDLTGFRTADDWKKVLKAVGIKGDAKLVERAWVWEGNGITIRTGSNPITGEYGSKGRDTEVGYASYIGIEGDAKLVKKAADTIRKLTDDIKEETPHESSFI